MKGTFPSEPTLSVTDATHPFTVFKVLGLRCAAQLGVAFT